VNHRHTPEFVYRHELDDVRWWERRQGGRIVPQPRRSRSRSDQPRHGRCRDTPRHGRHSAWAREMTHRQLHPIEP
jgi:hypothetical protein